MKTIVTRGGKLIAANVHQSKPEAGWRGEAVDGALSSA